MRIFDIARRSVLEAVRWRGSSDQIQYLPPPPFHMVTVLIGHIPFVGKTRETLTLSVSLSHARTGTDAHARTHTRTCVHTHTHIYTHARTHKHTHACKHVHVHTHSLSFCLSPCLMCMNIICVYFVYVYVCIQSFATMKKVSPYQI